MTSKRRSLINLSLLSYFSKSISKSLLTNVSILLTNLPTILNRFTNKSIYYSFFPTQALFVDEVDDGTSQAKVEKERGVLQMLRFP